MHPFIKYFGWSTVLCGSLLLDGNPDLPIDTTRQAQVSQPPEAVCNCNITQDGNTYPISALMGSLSAPAFYSYNVPNNSSANTGLELSNGLILFLYEDINTGIISLFLIADIPNSGSGGSLQFEFNCAPAGSYVSVQDDAGEFAGAPPLFTGNWSWSSCCTDGGVIENIGCNTNMNLDLLVSSGIDSIVWMTGDIANPTQILLNLTGEAISINCGGGVCCPIGFDTEIIIVDATCPDAANGTITVNPQDGVAPFSYDWSNGADTPVNADLLPGSYTVTITDAQGCTEELTMVVAFSPGYPASAPASIELCSVNPQEYFDLTSVESTINVGSGFPVQWFEDANLTTPISNPSQFLTGSTTVYAVVDNNGCLSEPVEVALSLLLTPTAFPTSFNACEDHNGIAIFDLTLIESIVMGSSSGNVMWYENPGLSIPINDPENYESTSGTIYATIEDLPCISEPVEIELNVDPKPEGESTDIQLCGDANNEAVFDLTTVEVFVSGGNGSVDWYLEIELFDQITTPSAFQTTTTTVYAVVFDGICFSDPIPVELLVEPAPVGTAITISSCGDGSGEAIFNLWDYELQISGGTGSVDWFLDQEMMSPIPNPGSFMSGNNTIYASLDNGTCTSGPYAIQLVIVSSVMANATSISVCDEGSGTGIFNLPAVDPIVSNGTGIVSWYLDIMGTMPIAMPDSFMSAGGTVYAQVIAGTCESEIVPVMLDLLSSLTAHDTLLMLCGNENASSVYDLTALDAYVSGGLGTVQWFGDAGLLNSIPNTNAFVTSDTLIYAVVTSGACQSAPVEISIEVGVSLFGLPLADSFCLAAGDTLTVDLTQYNASINGGVNQVNWYLDTLGTVPVPAPSLFQTDSSKVVYAEITDGFCTAPIVAISLQIAEAPVALPHSIERCGDSNGQAQIDLTASDLFISDTTGLVLWYTDANLTTQVANTTSFITGDTTLYVVVTNSFCSSAITPVPIIIVDSLTANGITIQACVTDVAVADINLLSSDIDVSGGNGLVSWFTDSLGTNAIGNPASFITSGDTVYAQVAADGCFSPVVPVIVDLDVQLTPVITCLFSSADSIAFGWQDLGVLYDVTYWINDIEISTLLELSNSFHLGNLSPGSEIEIEVVPLYATNCPLPIAMASCSTAICLPATAVFPGLDTVYCKDEPLIALAAIPAGGQFSGAGITGNELNPALITGFTSSVTYEWTDIVTGCPYDTVFQLNFVEPPEALMITCISEYTSVTFNINANANLFAYQIAINDGTFTSPDTSTISSKTISPVMAGDKVEMLYWVIGQAPCENGDTVSVICHALSCPDIQLSIVDPGLVCSESVPIQLEYTAQQLTGNEIITWYGEGITDPSGMFHPVTGPGDYEVFLTVAADGCVYEDSNNIHVTLTPVSSFTITGSPCLDSTLLLEFTGYAFYGGSDWHWEFDGAEAMAMPPPRPADFLLHWNEPGVYEVSLWIDYLGCTSDTFAYPVQIDAPLSPLHVQCVEENYYDLVIAWEPVIGATDYSVSHREGNGKLSGTTYTISNLQDDTDYEIIVTATGPTACGPVSDTLECTTLDFIPVSIFIPDIFSPNQDDINDIFFIQSNPTITSIHSLRIFDRWGNLVFENLDFLPNDPRNGWDGSFSGKSLNPGVYLYLVEYESSYGEVAIKTGDVTLVR